MSKTMQVSELNYSVTEKELLAIIYAIKKFYTIIAGFKTKNFTDHMALTFLNLCKNPTPRISRWLLYLQPLHLEFEYINGRNNCIADAVRRNPIKRDEIYTKDKTFNINNLSAQEFTEFIEEIIAENALCQEANTLWLEGRTQFLLAGNVIYHRQNERWLVIIP